LIQGEEALNLADRTYAIARFRHDSDIVAVRAQHVIRLPEFLSDIEHLAARLPQRDYVLNLCHDRYRFMVGFVAALIRRQVTLLPSNTMPTEIRAIAEDYPNLYALTDTEIETSSVPSLEYPMILYNKDRREVELPTLPGEQTALILFTSGSTGRPRPVPKTWGTLVRSARAAGDQLGISRYMGATLIGTVPHQHSYGLESTVLLPLQHGLVIEAGSPFYPSDIRAAINRAVRPRIFVTAPVHLRALMAEWSGMPPVDLILSATAPLTVSLAGLAEVNFAAPLIEIYGCTEAGQIAYRRTTQTANWRCFDGIILHDSEQGTWVSGSSVEGTTLLQDIIEHMGRNSFCLRGRSTDLVDVAGKRTSLAFLNHHLLSIEGVQDGVFLMPETSEERVVRLAALVVAPTLRSATVLKALRARIDSAFLPRPLVLVEKLPRTSLGKLPRESLLKLVRNSQGR
jgi:acyl-coenzyme A synthetase/AMP-(fatty) acid ligase